MSFDSLPFLVFFVLLYVAVRVCPSTGRLRTCWPSSGWLLLAASAVCYAFAGFSDTLLFTIVILVNYLISLRLAPGGRGMLAVAIAFNAAVLIGFKYRNFLFGLDPASGSYAAAVSIPLGISFYTFQSVAYLTDVYRGEIKAERSLQRFALFKSFFPQLVAGPIVRAHLLLPQVQRLFAGTLRPSRLVGFGLCLCLVGLIKKVVLADSIAPVVDDIFDRGPADAATAWLGVLLFAFQIYFDFSGYSDMAVGMARMLSVRLPVNFRTPYLATSPRDFWQRWHVTLSTWIRDYLYVPLGGSRTGGAVRQAAVLVVVMGLAGLWHGANWTFLVWGLLWGAVIAAWRVAMSGKLCMPAIAGWALTMLAVLTLWVFFRAPDVGFAVRFLGAMTGMGGLGPASMARTVAEVVVAVSAVAALFALHVAESRAMTPRLPLFVRRWDGPTTRGILVALIAWLLILPKANVNPFIYFRF